jgi:hypothetical protein
MVQKFCDEPRDEVPHGSRLRPTDFSPCPTEKKFRWSRRGIAPNGIFAATNGIKKKPGARFTAAPDRRTKNRNKILSCNYAFVPTYNNLKNIHKLLCALIVASKITKSRNPRAARHDIYIIPHGLHTILQSRGGGNQLVDVTKTGILRAIGHGTLIVGLTIVDVEI